MPKENTKNGNTEDMAAVDTTKPVAQILEAADPAKQVHITISLPFSPLYFLT